MERGLLRVVWRGGYGDSNGSSNDDRLPLVMIRVVMVGLMIVVMVGIINVCGDDGSSRFNSGVCAEDGCGDGSSGDSGINSGGVTSSD